MKMDKDLIIDVTESEVSLALLDDHRLIEYSKEKTQERRFSVGDVYIGKVRKLLPSLNAAFVDIGDQKDAFVHYLDLGLNFTAFDNFVRKINGNSDFKTLYQNIPIDEILEKDGRIERFLSPGQPIIFISFLMMRLLTTMLEPLPDVMIRMKSLYYVMQMSLLY